MLHFKTSPEKSAAVFNISYFKGVYCKLSRETQNGITTSRISRVIFVFVILCFLLKYIKGVKCRWGLWCHKYTEKRAILLLTYYFLIGSDLRIVGSSDFSPMVRRRVSFFSFKIYVLFVVFRSTSTMFGK